MNALNILRKQHYPYQVTEAYSRLSMEEKIDVLKERDLEEQVILGIATSRSLNEEQCRLIALHPNANERSLELIVPFISHHEDILIELVRHPRLGKMALFSIAKLGLLKVWEEIKARTNVPQEVLILCETPVLYFYVEQDHTPKHTELYDEYKSRVSNKTAVREAKSPGMIPKGSALYRVNSDNTMTFLAANWDTY